MNGSRIKRKIIFLCGFFCPGLDFLTMRKIALQRSDFMFNFKAPQALIKRNLELL